MNRERGITLVEDGLGPKVYDSTKTLPLPPFCVGRLSKFGHPPARWVPTYL